MSRSELVIGKEFGKLKEKSIAVIGVGGTGCIVIQLLSRLPFKKIHIIDGDFVEESNLERQFLYTHKDVGRRKVDVAKEKLDAEHICAHSFFANEENIPIVDLIIDCTDNIESRKSIDAFCRKNNIPWIYTGAVGLIGAIYFVAVGKNVVNILKEGDACCAVGVLNTLVSLVGSWAVSLAVQYLTVGRTEEKMIRINLETNEVWKITV